MYLLLDLLLGRVAWRQPKAKKKVAAVKKATKNKKKQSLLTTLA